MRLVVTVDTEADNQWEHGIPIATRNVRFWPAFQDICERYSVSPTYLLTSEIVADERACDLLDAWRRRGAAEVGAHLHPWTTPPFLDQPGLRYNDPVHAFAAQLPSALLEEKVAVLTDQIHGAFGVRPTSHRSGRFGFDARAAVFLAREGYLVDSSVTPSCTWAGHRGLNEGGPDFRAHTPHPFLVAMEEAAPLVEVPVTIMPTYGLLSGSSALLRAYQSLPARATRKLLLGRWLRPQPIWLSPDPRYQLEDLITLWRCARAAALPAAVMILHSSELMPGGSPFRPDKESVAELLQMLEEFLAFVRRDAGAATTLTSLGRALLDEGRLPKVHL